MPPDPGAGAAPPVAAHALLSAFAEAPIGMAVLTVEGVVLNYNSALGSLLDQPTPALLGRTLFDITHPEDLQAARENCALMAAGLNRIIRHECRMVRPDGSTLWAMVSTSRPAAVPGKAPHLIMHVEDITDRKAMEAELIQRALHDPLTGLPNRLLLLDRVSHALARSLRSGSPACLFYLDLNGFKAVNDTHGHGVGDELLQQLARRLTDLLRPGDTAARLGGDEFAVLCEDTDADQAAAIAERLHTAAATPFALGPHTVALTAAIGLSTSDTHHDADLAADAAALLSRADLRMYDAKRGTRPESP